MTIRLEDHLRGVAAPANLRINDQIHRYRERCRKMGCERPYHHFAFGQSPFPPPAAVVRALAEHAADHDYLPTAGVPALREAIARFYRHHFDLEVPAGRVVISPGSKEMISMVLAVLEGSVLIPTPSWVSYLPQAKILRKEVLPIRTGAGTGYKLTPDLLEAGVGKAAHPQRILILNNPNNPTGALYEREELEALAHACRRHGVVVLSDEIYALTSFGAGEFTSMAGVYPEGTIVTGGLSKDRSCGGYRLGVGIFPEEPAELLEDILKVAGSTYSCVAAPIQQAALAAYSLSPEVEDHMRDCREVNALIGRKTAERFTALEGVRTSTPRGGFYLHVDFNRMRDELLGLGFGSCEMFCEDVIAVEHTAMLPGSSLLLPDDDFSVRCSYVDYDGERALEAWRRAKPSTVADEESFYRKHAPLIADGIEYLDRYLGAVRRGERPRHA